MVICFPVYKKEDVNISDNYHNKCYSVLQDISQFTGIPIFAYFLSDDQSYTKKNLEYFWKKISEEKLSPAFKEQYCKFYENILNKASQANRLIVDEILPGFKAFALPVEYLPGETLFYVAGGLFFLDKAADPLTDETLKKYNLSPSFVKSLIKSIPIVNSKRFDTIIARMQDLADIYQEEDLKVERDHKEIGVVNFISELAQQLTGEINLKEILLSIVEQVSTAFEVDKCAISLLDDSRKFIEIFASNNEYADEIFGGKIEPGVNATGIVTSTGKTFYTFDVVNDPRLSVAKFKDWNIRSILSAPLKVGEQVVGIIHLVAIKKRRFFSRREIEFAEALASELSLVVEIARLFNISEKRALDIAHSRDEIKSYFNRMATALSTSLDLKHLLKLIVEMSVYLTRSDAGSIYLIDDKKLTRYVAVAFEDKEEKKKNLPLPDLSMTAHTTEHFLQKKFGTEEFRSYLGIPLENKGEIKGLLNILDREPREYTPEEVELLAFFSGHAAMAIENARLFQSEQEKAREATALYSAVKAIGESVNLEGVLNCSVEQISQLVGIDRCLILLLDYKNLELQMSAYKGLSEEQIDFFSFYRIPIDEIGDDLWEPLVQGKPIKLPTQGIEHPSLERILKVFPTSSCLLVPLLTKEQLVGIIYLDDSRLAHSFSDSQVRRIMTLALQIASAINRATLMDQLKLNLDQLKALYQVSTAITGTLSKPKIFELMVNKSSQLIDAPAVSMLAWDQSAKKYVLVAQKGLTGDLSDENFHRLVSERTIKQKRYTTYYVSSDEGEYPLIYSTLQSASIGGYISLPLMSRKTVVGILNCFCRTGDRFDLQEINLLLSFANQGAIAVENANLYNLIKNKVRELATVYELGKSITSTLDLEKVLDEIASSVVKVMEGEGASIMLLDSEHEDLTIIRTLGLRYYFQGEIIKVSSGTAGIAVKMGRPMILHDDPESSSPYTYPRRMQQEGYKTILSVPMKIRDKVIGLINLYKKDLYYFSPMEINLLMTLANQAGIAVENARLYNEQYKIAQIIRRQLMPNRESIFERIDVGYVYIPSEILSGDYFEVISLGENRYGLVIADVSGKGTEAAIYNARAKYILRSYAAADYAPEDILTLLNNLMEEETANDKFISLLYIDMDLDAMEITYASAGHEPLIVWDNSNKEVKILEESSLPIGVFPDTAYTQQHMEVKSGDILVLYTDGIVEARSREGEFFGMERLIKIIKDNNYLSSQALANKIFTSVQKFTRRKINDDFSLLVVRV